MTFKPIVMAIIAVVVVAESTGSIAGGVSQLAGKPTTTARPQPAGSKGDPRPTPELRERMRKLFEMRKARMARAAAVRAAAIQREKTQFQQRQRAELASRNTKTRAERAPHLREADSPAGRAAGRRVDIGREAAELLRRSKTATAAEQAVIDRRAGELLAELERLK